MGFFSDSKDLMLSSLALPMLNNAWLKPYGQATALKLNSTDKALEITLELKGESEPLRLHVQEYELVVQGSQKHLVIKRLTTSREWMTELARNFLIGKQLPLPAEAAGVLAKCL